MNQDIKYAVLIDADNISDKYIKIILDEVADAGIATYKRICGDWTDSKLSSWKKVLLDNSITPIQQYGYTIGKNSTDSAMIIDAMDILYSKNVEGFCLVSSDSDFTRLATRLRESGMIVIGMGESKTPKPFITACNQFKYVDILFQNLQQNTKETKIHPKLGSVVDSIISLVKEKSDDDGWIFSGFLGNLIAKRYPDFDVRNFGYEKFIPFIESLNRFEVKKIPNPDNNAIQLVYIRLNKAGCKNKKH